MQSEEKKAARTMMPRYFYIAAVLVLLLPAMAVAQDAGFSLKSDGVLRSTEEIQKKEFLNKFYDRCTAVPDKNQSVDSQSDMCICETLHMEKFLTGDEIEIMATGKGKGYVRKNVLYQEVYAPCLEFPAREIARYECFNSRKIQDLVSTQNAYKGTCECTGNKAAEYFRAYAKPQLEALMEKNPIMEDPLGAILQSFDYRKYLDQSEQKCLETYQVKWDDYYRKLQTQEQKK